MKFATVFLAALLSVSAHAADSAPAKEKKAPLAPLTLAPPTPGWKYEELRRMPAPEAGQGAAADKDFVYAINNHTIAKYKKETGEKVATWEGTPGGSLVHMNAGVVFEGKLYCAHSNYPAIPMLSSVEIFDAATLKHVGSHSFGRMDGSFTWLDRRVDPTGEGRWVACFVHYGKKGGEPNRGPEWTQIVEFDDQWRRTGGWGLPPDLVTHIGERGYSASGGAMGPRGLLYITGHDHPELFVLDFPDGGSVLKWVATIPITAEGQAFGWDPVKPEILYTIGRKAKEVIVGRVTGP